MPSATQISGLESHQGYWLRLISNAVSQRFARRVEVKGVTVAEWVFLRVLYDHEELAPSSLAIHMAMTKGAVTKLADRLIHKKFVKRAANKNDNRAQTLTLTAKARMLVPQLAAAADENDEVFFGILGAGDRATLGKILKRLAAAHQLKDVPTS